MNTWKQRYLSIKGKIVLLKTLAISKVTMSLSLLPVDKQIIGELKKMFFNFIWKSTERIKRNTLIGDYQDGGMKMIDLELFEKSLKASWVTKLYGKQNALNPVAKLCMDKICKNQLILLHGTYDKKSTLVLNSLPTFYREVLCDFSECLDNHSLMNMNTVQFLSQQIWFNKNFMYKGQCLNFKNWMEIGIIYVRDLFDENGEFISGNIIFKKLIDGTNWISEYLMIEKVFKRYNEFFNDDMAQYSKSGMSDMFHIDNKTININRLTSKIFHNCLIRKKFCLPISQKVWCHKFNIEYKSTCFKDIYNRKIKDEKIAKLSDFKYKLLHNILITNSVRHKWNNDFSKDCTYCLETEDTEHMLFTCNLTAPIWKKFEICFKCSIKWKIFVLGYSFGNGYTEFIERNISMIAWSMYNYKIKCKMKGTLPSKEGMLANLKYDLTCFIEFHKLEKKDNLKRLLLLL